MVYDADNMDVDNPEYDCEGCECNWCTVMDCGALCSPGCSRAVRGCARFESKAEGE